MWCERLVGTRLLYAWKFCQTLSSLYQNKGSNVEANLTIQNDGVDANFGYKDDDFDGLTDINHFNIVDYFEDHN